jgi:adenine-specific DNA methylase
MEQTIKCFNEDIIELLNSGMLQPIFNGKKSIAYIDPPYGGQSSDYPKLYSFLEEYIHMKPLNEIEKIQKFNRYAKKKGYEEQFIEFLDALNK